MDCAGASKQTPGAPRAEIGRRQRRFKGFERMVARSMLASAKAGSSASDLGPSSHEITAIPTGHKRTFKEFKAACECRTICQPLAFQPRQPRHKSRLGRGPPGGSHPRKGPGRPSSPAPFPSRRPSILLFSLPSSILGLRQPYRGKEGLLLATQLDSFAGMVLS